MHYEFEAKVPVEHVKHVIAMVREGVPDKGKLLICVASAAGEVGALIDSFENPEVVPIGSPTIEQMSENELFQELDDALQTSEAAQISPFVLALILKALEYALDYLKNR